MGWTVGTDKWVLKFDSTGVSAFNTYIASDVLHISFTESRIIVLKKATFLQFKVVPTATNTNAGKVDF